MIMPALTAPASLLHDTEPAIPYDRWQITQDHCEVKYEEQQVVQDVWASHGLLVWLCFLKLVEGQDFFDPICEGVVAQLERGTSGVGLLEGVAVGYEAEYGL